MNVLRNPAAEGPIIIKADDDWNPLTSEGTNRPNGILVNVELIKGNTERKALAVIDPTATAMRFSRKGRGP